MTISAAQCRAGRALADWSQDDLAVASRVAKTTIAAFEAGKRMPYDRTLADLVAAFATQGIQFTDGDGVRRAKGAENGEGPGVRPRKASAQDLPIKPEGPATDAVLAMDTAIKQHKATHAAPPSGRRKTGRSTTKR